MPTPKPITIVGGGLAGLALGIALRQRGVPTTMWEAGAYPRHRVCGEFISGRGLDVIERLGLREKLLAAGAREAENAAFFTGKLGSPALPLPQRALCISRHSLDALLAREFASLGGELREQARWRDGKFCEGVVRATGRRIEPVVGGWRWFGLKAHVRGVTLTADLEMHFGSDRYVGLCRLDGGVVNVCGLFRSATPVPDLPLRRAEWLRGEPGTPLHHRLTGAEFDEASFSTVAGLSLRARRALDVDECCIGDALTMIPPVTGNGMSIAFESAEIASEPLANFSAGRRTWTDVQHEIAQRCDATFARRLRWAAWLQSLLFKRFSASALVWAAPRWRWMWDELFAATR
ncbi:MAG: FAD-dependent monooxygenase [Verrucomicrobia bacterium]|nr:FAD-dependent monooxygenase [Verrucomicrobiota bacterium]